MRAADALVRQTLRQPWTVVLALSSLLSAAAVLALPALIGEAVDGDTSWLALTAATAAVLVSCDALAAWSSGAGAARATAWVRRRAVRHVLEVGPAMTRRHTEGDLVTRIGVNAEEVGRVPDSVITGLSLLVPSAGALVMLVLIDFWLALALLAGLAVIALVLRALLRVTARVSGDYQEAQAELAGRLLDALAGARTIAAARTADRETERVLGVLPALREHALALWRANADAGMRAGLVVPLLEIAVLCVGGLRLASGDLSVGELYAAARYVVLGSALGSGLGQVAGLARARAAAVRVAALSTEPSLRYGTRPLPTGPGTLEFREADGLDLVIPGGELVAVVGRSGAGKSHLAALAGRLADPEHGEVRLDGVPLPRLSREALRRGIGVAWERPALVGSTVLDTVALGGGEPFTAARKACADGFVERLPEGYRTPLAQVPLSGGERQRLGLARAFAQARRVLVLDDATSSLDLLTERRVAETLASERRTRVVVTHRVATAASADWVVWLEGGRVRGYDRHEALWYDPAYRAVFG
ncbi:ABC transporter ATP-binding protein [Nonomuraea sp. NPDC050310]|uniref:ABC transporter ATP-binding protein n=1 Tax=Nonomuraea sp. NPDC050310 TaxID=3154935 RepID=UPI0033CDE78B